MTRFICLLCCIALSLGLQAQQTQPASKARTGIGFRVTKSDFQLFMDELTAKVRGRIGVAAMLIETGETVAYHGDDRFPMQSVYKFPIGMTALYLADQGVLRLNKPITVTKKEYLPAPSHSPLRDRYPEGATVTLDTLLRYAVSESDNSASDLLLRLVGGGSAVTNYLRSLGITGMIVKNSEQEMQATDSVQYANWAKPTEVVHLLRQVQVGKGLSASSRAALLRMMTETTTGPKRLKGMLPPGTVVAHKTGTSGTKNGVAAATNDVGLITLPDGRQVAVAVFIADAKADQTTRETTIAQIARRLWDRWQ